MKIDRIKPLESAEVAGKRVLYRADLNVPAKKGIITDFTRITRMLPGLQKLILRGAKVIILSHYGRPKNGFDAENSLKPVADALKTLLSSPVGFVPNCIGEQVEESVGHMNPGDVLVLENTRFYPEEENNDPIFSRSLARLADLYVNDAFSVSHRAHASTEGLTHYLPSYAGPLLLEEINALKSVLETPQRPTIAIVGGAKVSTKIPILTNLLPKFDTLIIGGGMANTFLQSLGLNIGRSLSEPDYHALARDILNDATSKFCNILLPIDAVIARELRAGAPYEIRAVENIPHDFMILDVGPLSCQKFTENLKSSRTLLWNGPLGAFEFEPFGSGTFSLAQQAAKLTKAGQLISIAGGGDTVAALNTACVTEEFTYVSTAGGAFLEWLEGRDLPGIVALLRTQNL